MVTPCVLVFLFDSSVSFCFLLLPFVFLSFPLVIFFNFSSFSSFPIHFSICLFASRLLPYSLLYFVPVPFNSGNLSTRYFFPVTGNPAFRGFMFDLLQTIYSIFYFPHHTICPYPEQLFPRARAKKIFGKRKEPGQLQDIKVLITVYETASLRKA